MKALILIVIGVLAGALCTAAAMNALSKRGAHGRAVMVLLARHVDALQAYQDEAMCTGDEARARLQQIAFAAREIDYAFADIQDTTFARRNAHFRSVTESVPHRIENCAVLDQVLSDLGESCRSCHRNFR